MTSYFASLLCLLSGNLGAYHAIFCKPLIYWLLISAASWFLTDVFGHLTYGEPIGCVKRVQDVDGLMSALQSLYSMVATVAVSTLAPDPIDSKQVIQKDHQASSFSSERIE